MAMASSQSIRSESEMVPESQRPVMPADLFRAVMKEQIKLNVILMAMASSQSIRSESQMLAESRRPVMPADLFRAVMKGDVDVLKRRLGLQLEQQPETQVMKGDSNVLIPRLGLQLEEQPETKVTIEASSAPEEIDTENQTVQSELQSATHFGDTILHLLITKGHNKLALMVFKRDMSLLKARNKLLETPLYCAAKVGNEEVIRDLIQCDCVIMKEALEERNKNGDTVLHVAAQHDHTEISRMLMNLDVKLAYKVNDKKEYPLYMAIIEGNTEMVMAMLEVDPTLACTPFSDGMFPVHEAARMDNDDLVLHFIEKYPDDAELLDPCGRNFFHIAAEENKSEIFLRVSDQIASQKEMFERMNSEMNNEGNIPFHIAAKKGHRTIMRAIWESYQDAETMENKNGYTPLELSAMQVKETKDKDIIYYMIDEYLDTNKDCKFTRQWFEIIMEPQLDSKWERTQVIGLGSVLITTVAFAAAFTMPGGYNQDNGTPVLGGQYMFWAFIVANALAFLLGFLSLLALLLNGMPGRFDQGNISYATYSFLYAASSMAVAFGLGLYVTLAPVCYHIATFLLVTTLIVGSPAVIFVLAFGKQYSQLADYSSSALKGGGSLVGAYLASFLIIFCLPLYCIS